jgi:hypothetical protein
VKVVRERRRATHAIVHEIVTTILPEYPTLDPAVREQVVGEVSAYVAAQIQSMPEFLRLPYALALFGFDALPAVRYGRRFRALPAAARLSYLARWDDAPIAAMRDVVKLLRSSALLSYFDHPLVVQRMQTESQRSRPRAAYEAADE